MTNRKLSLIAAVVLTGVGVSSVPSTALAGCCCAPAKAQIVKTEAKLMTRIEVMEEQIVKAIGTHGEKIHYTITDQTEAQASMINGLADALREQMERQKHYDAQAKAYDDFGNPSPVICNDANAAAAAVAGSGAAQQAEREIRDGFDERWEEGDSAGAIVSAYETLEDDPTYLDVENLLIDPAAFSSEDEEKRKEILDRLYSFTPPVQLDEASEGTPQGIVFQAKRKEQEVRLAPVKSILSALGGEKSPTYEFSGELETLLAETGYTSTEQGREALEKARREGKISEAMFEQMMVESRSVTSPKYLGYIEGMKGADLQREMIKQVSINNQLLYAQLQMDRRRALLAASSEADRVDKDFAPQINALRIGGASSSPDALISN